MSQCGASSRCAASSFPRSAVSAVVPAADQLILPHTGRRAGGGSCAGTCDQRSHGDMRTRRPTKMPGTSSRYVA